MGKKHRSKRGLKIVKAEEAPSVENPICPACGMRDRMIECMPADDVGDPLYECCRCWVRFMLEDSRVEIEEDDDDIEAQINMGSVAARDFNNAAATKQMCEICDGRDGVGKDGKPCQACKPSKKKKDEKDYQTEPLFGEMEELTDAVAKR